LVPPMARIAAPLTQSESNSRSVLCGPTDERRGQKRLRARRALRVCASPRAHFERAPARPARKNFFEWYEACPPDLRGAAVGARVKLLHGARVPPRSRSTGRGEGESGRKRSTKTVVPWP